MNKISIVVSLLLFEIISGPVFGAVQFWDPDGVTAGTSISGNWDTTTSNWTDVTDSGINNIWVNGNDATFGIAANYTVTLTQPITVANLSVVGSAGTLTLSGSSVNNLTLGASCLFNTGGRGVNLSLPIDGSFDLTRSGAGTVTISGANTYSGGTTVNAGTSAVAVDSIFSGGLITSGPFGTGPVTIGAASTISGSGGAHVIDNPIKLNAGLTIGGSTALTFRNGDFSVLGANRTLTVNNSADTTIVGSLTDDAVARTLTKAGTGRLILAGTNPPYLGQITVSAGTLAVGSTAAIPTNNNNLVSVSAGATFNLNGFDTRVSRVSGAGSVVLGANTITAGNNSSSAELSGPMSGTGGYVKVGTVSQVLSGTNTFTGGILITEGPIYFPTNAATGSPIALGPGPNVITITNTGSIGQNKVGMSIITNSVVLANVGPTAILDPAGAATVEFYLAGPVSGSGGILRSSKGSGVAYLTGSNSFSGGVEVDARILGIGNKNALGTGTFILGNPATGPGGNPIVIANITDLSGANAITNVTVVNQSFAISATNNFELAGPITTVSNTAVITALGDSSIKISGAISGAGGIGKAGSNTLTLAANNSYTGPTPVSEGILALTGAGSIGTSSNVTVALGAALDLSGSTSGTLTRSANQTLGGSGTIIAGPTGSLDLSGGGTLVWTLSANNTDPSSFDMLTLTNGTLVLGGSSKFSINFTNIASSPDGGDPFWASPQSWTVLTLTNANNPGNSDFTSVLNGVYAHGYFTTAASSTNIVLQFTPGAPPSPAFTGLTGAGTGNPTINFTAAVKGATYQVEYVNDLNDTNWTVLGTVPGTGSNASIVDTTNPHPGQRFYRVVLK